MEKTLHFITGLPRTGTTLLTNIFKQNENIHGESVSSLASLIGTVHSNWNMIEQNNEYENLNAKIGVLRGMLYGYYSHINKPYILDKERAWVSQIPLLEVILDRPVKMICMVRNPAEILASFEKLRNDVPLYFSLPDTALRETSTIASRAMFYAGPSGPLGMAHSHLKDAITMGFKDRLLFVDYNKFCAHPKAQMKRICDFLELPVAEYDFNNIRQTEQYNDNAVGLKNIHTVRPLLQKTNINAVQYIGLDLYQQYNSQIFWDAWV